MRFWLPLILCWPVLAPAALLAQGTVPDAAASVETTAPGGAAAANGVAPSAPAEAVAAPEGWSLHAQATVIEQGHFAFPSPYEGVNSLEGQSAQDQHTVTATLFLGRALWPGGELYLDPEVSEGNGLSGTVGVAGFPNGEATRAGSDSPKFNTARLFLRQTFGLGGEKERIDPDQNQLGAEEDVDRLTLTFGKFAAVDQFDDNAYSHDPRTQFLNWSLMDSGAWDYPADTKGYTVGFTAVLNCAAGALSYGWLMEPREANGLQLDHNLAEAWGQVLQWAQRYRWSGHAGTVRPFIFWNHADMGSYAEALSDPAADLDITRTRSYRSKFGAGVSWDQELSADLGAFARASWNDGRNESWAFTEIDRSGAAGLALKGTAWGRKDDLFGFAGVENGLSPEHRRYLAAGGYGFIVGDGRLNYGYEEIVEAYYAFKVWSWLVLTPDYQYVEHPGYNRDRGGVSIYAIRAHVEF